MAGKLVSLFKHPEFVRRAQARATRHLKEQLLEPARRSDNPPELDAIEAFLEELLREKP